MLVPLCSYLQSLELCSFLIEPSYYSSEICRQADSRNRVGGTADTLLYAMNGMIDYITKTTVFFSL
jgi:hypothetical protein